MQAKQQLEFQKILLQMLKWVHISKNQHCILPLQKCFGPSKSIKMRFKLSDIWLRSQFFFFVSKSFFFVVHFFYREGIAMFTFVGYTCEITNLFFFCFKIDFFVVHFFFLEGISMFTFVGYTCEITKVCFFKLSWSHTNSCDLKVFWWDHPWILWVISLQKGLQFVSPASPIFLC